MPKDPQILARWSRGLPRAEAAEYMGLGITTFSAMVRSGELPMPVKFRSKDVWDIRSLDDVFDSVRPAVPPLEVNTWD